MYLANRPEGTISNDEQIMGTYLHGLFEQPEACSAMLRWAGVEYITTIDHNQRREQSIDALADAVGQHLNTEYLLELLSIKLQSATSQGVELP